MPIEIRELILSGSIAREEDKGEESVKLLTEKDLETLKQEVTANLKEEGGLTGEAKRELMDEVLREVRKIIDEKWRR